jgi:glycosyltransferase involved in cell wall biosynthesis
MNLYLTADRVGTPTGGGIVTYHEREALRTLGTLKEISDLSSLTSDPFEQDRIALARVKELTIKPDLVHCYSGCLSETVRHLRAIGSKVTYTVAAHSIEESKKEHEYLGIPFEYPHLTNPELFLKYSDGYRLATKVICPSTVSAKTMDRYGMTDSIVIPHGCFLPNSITAPPKHFTVGYLGAVGPDKGLAYLFAAWGKLAYRDAVLKIAGRESNSNFCRSLLTTFGGGNVVLSGWVDNIEDFYNSISCYVQPSPTEGFGIEVLEALAHGRPVVVSDGAGAADVVTQDTGKVFVARNVPELAEYIDYAKRNAYDPVNCQKVASNYTWDKIRKQYIDLWRSL